MLETTPEGPLARILSRLSRPPRYQEAILRGLQHKPVYEGTVPAKVKARRRAANKRAKASRRANR